MKLLLLLFLTNICFAQEQIVDFEEKSLPVINNELRIIDNDIDDNTSDITTNKGGVMMDASDTLGFLNTKLKILLRTILMTYN